jgi:two-component system, cell cycle response regulator
MTARVLVVDDILANVRLLEAKLTAEYFEVITANNGAEALEAMAKEKPDIVLLDIMMPGIDGLEVCRRIKQNPATQHVPVIIVTALDQPEDRVAGLEAGADDMGVNDYLVKPMDRLELLARMRTQIRRCRYAQMLRDHVSQSMELAVTDPLTGFFNRRFLEAHVRPQVLRSLESERPVSFLVLDVDHFKSVNDSFGHDVGDRVLKEVAERIRRCVRGADYPCRIGGEEFVIALPDSDIALAAKVGERIRRMISAKPVQAGNHAVSVTISIGVAACEFDDGDITPALKRADIALYRAKSEGRNRVISDAA